MNDETKQAIEFFHRYAGYSYDPKTETVERGRARCAQNLTRAELHAKEQGWWTVWEYDLEIDSSDFSDDPEPYALWCASMVDADGERLSACLCGIDFGRDGDPDSEAYARVVSAELALELM